MSEISGLQTAIGYSPKEMGKGMPVLQDQINREVLYMPQHLLDGMTVWHSDVSAFCGDKDDDVGHIACTVNVALEFGSDIGNWDGILSSGNGIATTF